MHDRDGFFNVNVIFMSIVVEGDKVTIIFINTGSGDDRAAKITANVFGDYLWIAFIGFCVDIETL